MSSRKFYWYTEGYNEPVGKLIYDLETKQFTIESFDLDRKILPLHLAVLLECNRNPLTGSLADQWVQCRVEPRERVNISDILKCAGLQTYDVFGLLLYHNGRSVYDHMYLKEVSDFDH